MGHDDPRKAARKEKKANVSLGWVTIDVVMDGLEESLSKEV